MVRAAGGLVIADEVQAGYGRTGGWWGYDHAGLQSSDIAVTGKPMGAGLPLAATAASRALVEGFRARTRYFNTFASSPPQSAVCMSVLDVIGEEDLVANAGKEVGAALKDALGQRAAPFIGDERGRGPVHRHRGWWRRGRSPDRASRRRRGEPPEGQGVPDQHRRRLRQCGQDPPPLVFSHDNAAFLAAWDETITRKWRKGEPTSADASSPRGKEVERAGRSAAASLPPQGAYSPCGGENGERRSLRGRGAGGVGGV